MDFSGLRKKIEEEKPEITTINTEHLVVCFDYYSALLCQKFFESNTSFEIIGERLLDDLDVRLKGPDTFRIDDENLAESTPSIFYKDQKFRDFGGRSKSMELKIGEEFFSHPKVATDCTQITEETLSTINEKIKTKQITKIEKTESGYLVFTGDNCVYETVNLYWRKGLPAFVNALKNKSIMTESMLSKIGDLEGPIPLYIDIEVNKLIEKEKTMFLPVSLTHEQGHFIGDVKKINEKKSQFSFVHFIDPNEVNEEHIGRLIKNLKRQLEKIFELKRSMFGEDVIALSPIGIAKTIDDELASETNYVFKGLHLIGEQYMENDIFADSCSGWQSGFRGEKSLDIATLS